MYPEAVADGSVHVTVFPETDTVTPDKEPAALWAIPCPFSGRTIIIGVLGQVVEEMAALASAERSDDILVII
jgi:hypothetical protein